jgi:nitroimidazol reductase NimA-like FMN-containing flavoprotein (pyridoxamine 5'-phosphate oxidase superfamily)
MSEPRASRPRLPGYGVPTEPGGMLPWSWATERLAAAHNYWVATSGPHASPIWAVWQDGTLVFSCGESSRKARALAADPRIVVHLESGAEVVIVEGEAEQIAATPELLAAYAEKYGPVSAEAGNWYRVRAGRVLAWREEDYPRSATRFDVSGNFQAESA